MILAFHTDTYLSYNFTTQYRLCGDFIGEHGVSLQEYGMCVN